MESQKITNLLDHKEEDNPRFETKKWNIINDRNNVQYGGKGNEKESTLKINTEVLKPFLVDYSDAYIIVTEQLLKIVTHLLGLWFT